METPLFKHAIVTAIAGVTAILMTGGIASAHIDPDPIAMQVGASGTVAFNVEHGCDGSPMTDLKIQIPQGVTGVTAVEKAGWTATVTADTVEFSGGSLDAATPDHFDITLTAPTTAGDIHFPAIELCTVGEIDWIEIPQEGQPEPENVAPTIKITQDPPTAAELTPAPEADDDAAGTTVAGGTLVTTDIGATTVAGGTLATTDIGGTAAPLATATTVASKSDSSNTGAIVVVVVIVAAVLVGGGVLLTRRRGAAPKA
jgi:uncharacterized protein YcnI